MNNLRDVTVVLSTLTESQRKAHEAVVAEYEQVIKRQDEALKEKGRETFMERAHWIEQEDTCKAIAQGCVEALLAAALITTAKSGKSPLISWAAGFAAGGVIGYRIEGYYGFLRSLKNALRYRKKRRDIEKDIKKKERQEFIDAVNAADEKTKGGEDI